MMYPIEQFKRPTVQSRLRDAMLRCRKVLSGCVNRYRLPGVLGIMGVIAIGAAATAPLSASAAGATIDDFINGLKRGHVNLEALVALQALEKSDERIGYGLCMVAKRQDCAEEGSLGYGLCMAAGRNGCVEEGTLGYGLCMAGKRAGCEPRAGLGYGLCMAANRTQCEEKF